MVPEIITQLARLAAQAREDRVKGFDRVIEIEVTEAEQIVSLWRHMQDDGK